jgi:hypothetical protein
VLHRPTVSPDRYRNTISYGREIRQQFEMLWYTDPNLVPQDKPITLPDTASPLCIVDRTDDRMIVTGYGFERYTRSVGNCRNIPQAKKRQNQIYDGKNCRCVCAGCHGALKYAAIGGIFFIFWFNVKKRAPDFAPKAFLEMRRVFALTGSS